MRVGANFLWYHTINDIELKKDSQSQKGTRLLNLQDRLFCYLVWIKASYHFGTWHLGKRHFCADILSLIHFCMCMFRPCSCIGIWTFHLCGTGTFWHNDFLAPWTFRLRDISADGHFGAVAQVHIAWQGAKISMWGNVQVPKYPVPKHLWCQKFIYCAKICLP